ncbi:MAG: ABC transporter permease, partial [Ruminiclostridium sp.]|nr:ABC transporter permease [Ruminiclostridium sp.]
DAAASGTVSDIGSEIMGALPGLFNAGSIIAIIIVLILGFLFYALLAGLVGAGVSRSEDLAAAIQPLMLVAMLGFFLSYMSAVFNEDGSGNIVMTISRYIPISSPFALPSAILLGEMSGVETVISIACLALLTALTALLVSKVYETIILYSGNPLKLGQILKMAKNKEN